MKVYLFCLVAVGLIRFTNSQYNPLKDPNICGRPSCPGNGKFKYGPKYIQNYNYSIDVISLFNGTSKNESTIHIEAVVSLSFLTHCDGLLSLSDVKLAESLPGDDDAAPDHANSELFADMISEYTIRFAFKDGIIEELCPPEEEKIWVLNFKRGILSMLHNSMKRFDLDHNTIEDDVRGSCDTTYSIVGAKETSLIIKKTKNISTCTNRAKLHSVVQSTPVFNFPTKSRKEDILESSSNCQLSIDHNIYSEITCEETYLLQPFSNQDAGATTIVRQKLVLQDETETNIFEEQNEISRRTSLTFDHVIPSKTTNGEIKTARDLIKKLCKQSKSDFKVELSDLFSKFIRSLRLLSYPSLSVFYQHTRTTCPTGKKHLLDALPFVSTSASVLLMKDIILKEAISESVLNEWMMSIAFIAQPEEEMMDAALKLLQGTTFTPNIALSVASLTHTYCQRHSNNGDEVYAIVQHFENYFLELIRNESIDQQTQDNIVATLKSLSTIGVLSEDFQGELFRVIEDSNLDSGIRVAAVETFRRVPCEDTRSYFERIYRNQEQDAELRIAAYLQLMRCPNYLLIRTIRHTLANEEVNQVGSFVWSHLNSLLKSANPARIEVQSLLSEKDLVKKFSSDIRKFSHYREGSLYFDEYNFGGNFESSVIFSPSSYMPRTVMLNLTVDLFGESVNLLEVYGRMEGFEKYLESFFGPKGKSKAIVNSLENLGMRWARGIEDNEIIDKQVEELTNFTEKAPRDPKVSLGLKVFGNEVKYATFKGDEEIEGAVQTLNPVNYLKRILSGKEIKYNKASMFLDSSYVVPTGAGLPLSLSAVGTSSVDIALSGSFKAPDFFKNKELDVTANMAPTISLDVTGEMSVDAFFASTGIKLKTNMYTSSAIKGDIKVRGTKLVNVKFGLPKQNTKIFGVSSELLVKQKDLDQPQRGLTSGTVSNSACSWPVVDKTIGMKLCAEYNFINASRIHTAPYFILAGPARFECYLNKSNPTANTYLFEYKYTPGKDVSVVSIIFDNPGSPVQSILNANLTIDRNSQNLTMLLQSSAGTVVARGRYKNSDDVKYIQVALDINDKKHFDASASLERQKKINGYSYKPKLYLGVNGERVLELHGVVDLMSKKGVSQYTVDLKFQTKRLTSKLFGYISKTESSVGVDLHMDYKFLNTKEHRVSWKFGVGNRSRKNIAVIVGTCEVKSTAYPNLNFNTTVTFQRSGSHTEFKMTLVQNPLPPNDPRAEYEQLKFDLLFSFKSFTDSKRTIKAVAGVNRLSSNLDLKGEISYESINSDVNAQCVVKYGNNKQVSVVVFWSHPRTTLEQIKAHVNITVPSFSPMILKVEISEKQIRDYQLDIHGQWFSGHNMHAVGFYQDKSAVALSNHHAKLFIKSPNFKDFTLDVQYYRNNDLLKVDVKAVQEKNEYEIFLRHEIKADSETESEARMKYGTRLYTLKSSVHTGDYVKIVTELHIDQIRDIDFSLWLYNRETQKALGFDINWDANRDPNQKLLISTNFTRPGDYSYKADLIISYPGRTIVGKYDFLLKKGQLNTLATVSWDDGKSFAVDLDVTYRYDNELFLDVHSRINTPFDNWKSMKLFGIIEHLKNKYRFTGELTWDRKERVSLDLYGNYISEMSHFECKYSGSIASSLDRIPNINTTITHTHNETVFNTNLHLMYNPEFLIDMDSKWKIDGNENFTNLTGTILTETPFKGLNKGILISKIYLTNNKYLRGVADLNMDHRKMTLNMEGKFKKLTDSMFVVNATTPDELYQCRFIISKEHRHFVALLTYPNGSLGTEVLLQLNNLTNFDVKLYLATPIEFLQNINLVAKLQPQSADFRLGWNFLVLGFSGKWHYVNIVDFHYSYKLYTPIKDFEENGIVAKLVYKEGLDFEGSIKLSLYKLGVKAIVMPKVKILKEMGIDVKDIYGRSRNPNITNDDSFCWEGLIELDAIIYPTMKGKLEIDQNGPVYILQSKIHLPHGVATIFDKLEYFDIFSIKNDLQISTPYITFKTITSKFDLNLIPEKKYSLRLNLNYENNTRLTETGIFAQYNVETPELVEKMYNVTVELNTPFQAFPKLNLFGAFETEENFYHTKLLFNTNTSDISLEATTEIDNEWIELNSDFYVRTPIIIIPHSHLRLTKVFSSTDNYVETSIRVPEMFTSDIYFKTSWVIISHYQFKTIFQLETPFSGLENTTAGINVSFSNSPSTIWGYVQMKPLQFEVNSTLQDNVLKSSSLLDLNGKRYPAVLICEIIIPKPNERQFNGNFTLNQEVYNLTGNAEVIGSIPVNALIMLTPRNKKSPIVFAYGLKTDMNKYEINGYLRYRESISNYTALATVYNKFNWKLNLQLLPPDVNQKMACEAEARSTDKGFSLDVIGKTRIPKLETPKCGLKYSYDGLLHAINGFFEITTAKGSVSLDFIWKFMENMYGKVVADFHNPHYSSRSDLLAFYENPRKEFKFIKGGGDFKIDALWESGANLTLRLPKERSLGIEGHFLVPNSGKETHSLYGNLEYGPGFKFVEYLVKYRKLPVKKHGSWGTISFEDNRNITSNFAVQWDGSLYDNHVNLRTFDKSLVAIYKLKTPKYIDKQLFVTEINYSSNGDHHNVTCEAFYPEDVSVAFATVDYVQLANMKGVLNVTVPYKNIEYTGAFFNTETGSNVYNRYIKVFWRNDSAILDSKCDIQTGPTLQERNFKGKLIVELPLTTRHKAVVNYEYDKKPELSTGHAAVDYNGNSILEAKYNCLSESQAGLDKDTIHVELENNMVPLGADYVHRHEAQTGVGHSFPTVDNKHLHLYNLHNRSKFNVTGEVDVHTTDHGQEYTLAATHLNRTVKLWMDYSVLSQKYKQHSRLELSPLTWIEYDMTLVNKTVDDIFDAQLLLVDISYPRRNFTARGAYNISDSSVSTDFALTWNKDNKTVQAGLDWQRTTSHREQLKLQIKHPSFERDVSFAAEYGYDNKSIDGNLIVDYSLNPDKKLTFKCRVDDKSDLVGYNFTYNIWAEHNATSLSLNSFGDVYWNPSKCGTEHITDYKRSYLLLPRSVTLARANFDQNEIELKKDDIRGLSYFWGRYGGNFPIYTANISAAHGINHTSGEFYLNLRKKLLYLDVNMTEDGSQSMHWFGVIPNARSSRFDIWRDYEDKRISDVSYFLKLNHSRLIMSTLRWRPELSTDVQSGIRREVLEFYHNILQEISETKQYVRSETMEAVDKIWEDAKPFVKNFLTDLRNLTVIEEDIEYLKDFLNKSYNANEFYVKNIITILTSMFDELSLKTQLQSLPKIFHEIWQVMGKSGEEIRKSINYVIEKIKLYYKNTTEFIRDLINGDPVKQVSNVLEKLVEKYDDFIKNLHVSVLQYMEKLWAQAYELIVEHWHTTLATLEPTFLKFIHYLETIAWSTGKEFLDFLYTRKNKIMESAYFMEFSKFSRDLDKFYKDITGNNTIEAVYTYSNVAWHFIKEKYIKHIPFGEELQAVFVEILQELKQLGNIPSVRYLINKYYQASGYVRYYYNYFEVQNRIQTLLKFIYAKVSDMSVTALEIENRQRQGKTKFIFEPADGIMLMEQKLPMSWHAFNETPKFQEIPEIKVFYDMQNYLSTSRSSFWSFYYYYKPYTVPSEWFPPFKGYAMLMGTRYFATFDKKYYSFTGDCTYLLTTDTLDRNFTLLLSQEKEKSELILLVNKTLLHINRFDVNKNSGVGISKLPMEIDDVYLYFNADILTVESKSGFTLECNTKFQICMFKISGWYFGKTAGLWGTYNNEPYDDLMTSSKQKLNDSDLSLFGDTWSLDKECKSHSITVHKNYNETSPEIASICAEIFNSKVSQLSTCFPRVPKESFFHMCMDSTTKEEACMSAVAYIELCANENTPLRIPDICVKCNLLNGSEIQEGNFIRLQGGAVPQTADIVFIIEAKKCNKDLKHSKNLDVLVDSINQELEELNITENRYSVVVFGGDGVVDQARSVVLNGNIFADFNSIKEYFNGIPIGEGNNDFYNAIIFANTLIFRPGASRNFILLPCSECREYDMELDYSVVHQLLFENGVSLHILMNDSFTTQSGESKKRDNRLVPYGIDGMKAYSKKDIKNLAGDNLLKETVVLPKSTLGTCLALSFETNGTVFSATHLESTKNARKFSTVFGKRLARSAVPRDCTDCECTASNTGVPFMECYPCTHPRTNYLESHGYFEEDDAF